MSSKSQRKFRFWDNRRLFQNLERVVQIAEVIEKRAADTDSPLPESVIPTEILYDIAVCYEAMYNKLLDEELTVAGYHKSNSTYH